MEDETKIPRGHALALVKGLNNINMVMSDTFQYGGGWVGVLSLFPFNSFNHAVWHNSQASSTDMEPQLL